MDVIHLAPYRRGANKLTVVPENISLRLFRRKRPARMVTMVYHAIIITANARFHGRTDVFGEVW
jgi:hypothetical protein